MRMEVGRMLPVVDDGAATVAVLLRAVIGMRAGAVETAVSVDLPSRASSVVLGPA